MTMHGKPDKVYLIHQKDITIYIFCSHSRIGSKILQLVIKLD